MIYCLQILNFRYVKFGYTKSRDVSKRIAQLQTGCPFEIKPVFLVEGNIQQEKEFHKAMESAFGRHKIKIPPNEWYPGRTTLTKHIYQMVLNYNGGTNHAIAVLDSYNPNVNQGAGRRANDCHDVVKEWPDSQQKEWLKVYGEHNRMKAPDDKRLKKMKTNLL